MRFSFLSFTEMAKFNTGEIICNHQIAKLKKCHFFPIAKLSTRKIYLLENYLKVKIIKIN